MITITGLTRLDQRGMCSTMYPHERGARRIGNGGMGQLGGDGGAKLICLRACARVCVARARARVSTGRRRGGRSLLLQPSEWLALSPNHSSTLGAISAGLRWRARRVHADH
jgi:hypothetical protein